MKYDVSHIYCGMCIPLSDDKHEMVRDRSKKHTGQCGRNSNPAATLPHAAAVFRMQPFNMIEVMVSIRYVVRHLPVLGRFRQNF